MACAVATAEDAQELVTRSLAVLGGPLPSRGVNLAGAEFGVSADGSGALPGVHGPDHVWPITTQGYQDVSYYMNKGATTFRVPFRWERLQRSRRGALDTVELGRLEITMNEITRCGAVVVLDPHNYARYGTDMLDTASDRADFADFWKMLAMRFLANPKVSFAMMNEPYGFSTELWRDAVDEATAALRSTGTNHLLLVTGMAWTGAHSRNRSWYGAPNAQAVLGIGDSGNHLAFEVRQNLDADYSGNQKACRSATAGVEAVSGSTSWLKQNGKRGFLGEVGSGSSPTC